MAYCFGDSMDLYATPADAAVGYWDSGTFTNASLQSGRFAGGQCLQFNGTGVGLSKSSGANDAVHHIVCAVRQTAALSGTTLGLYFQLADAATNQVCIVFRSDGAMLLTSATPGGTVLATYTGAVSATNTWFAFEIEIVINSTTGSFTVRKNGNTSNDFSATSLNTRPGSNAYANKLFVGMQAAIAAQQFDDLLWRSDASSVPWVGDIRAYTRLPASDASAQFSKAPNPVAVTMAVFTSTGDGTGTSRYTPFTPTANGTVGSITIQMGAGFTGNLKCSLFSDISGLPGAVLGSATTIVNPATGANTATFGTPVSVTKGVPYWWGVSHDVTATLSIGNTSTGKNSVGVTYAAFPTASPGSLSTSNAVAGTVNITPTVNADFVSEAQQDGLTSYVYDANVNDADLYNIAPISPPPVSVVALTTRGFLCKSDAGTRGAQVQLKSGGTTVGSTATALGTSFGWLWRTDTIDPNTSAAWTPTAANAVQAGPKVTS